MAPGSMLTLTNSSAHCHLYRSRRIGFDCQAKVVCDWLRRVNPHELDQQVEFVEETHTYFKRGRKSLGAGLVCQPDRRWIVCP